MKVSQKQIALAILTALSSTSALALVGGSVDANTADSPWAGVGSITINGSIFSGVMLDSTHVLTAAHVVAGQVNTASNVSFSLNAGALSQTLSASSISVYPGYTGTTPGPDDVWHDDLAVITLSAPISDVVGYDLYGGNLSGQTITMVAYGQTGDGDNGITGGSSASVKSVGKNKADQLYVDDDGGSSNEVFMFDFDGSDSTTNVFPPDSPNNLTLGSTIEAQYASGDSGSPVFVNVGGVWKIAGIGTFNGSTSLSSGSNVLFGSVGGGTIVSSYIPWIQEQMAAPVPEPSAWVMMLVGMGLIGAAVRAKSRS